jgi:Uma2 family endonuclease
MAIPRQKHFITPEEYLRLEREASYKSEYYDGEIFAMAGGTAEHSAIVLNVGGELRTLLKGHRCAPYDSNLRIKIAAADLYTYPDVSVICGPLEYADQHRDMVTNPTLIVEVLSDSTEAYDRGKKFAHYRTLPSFAEYVIVSQKEPLVEVFFKLPDGTWQLTPARGGDAVVRLQSLGIELRLAAVFDRVEFPESVPLKPDPAA